MSLGLWMILGHVGGGGLMRSLLWSNPPLIPASSPSSELSAAFARHEPVRHHQQVHLHGQEGDQQAAQTEGEEERVDGASALPCCETDV